MRLTSGKAWYAESKTVNLRRALLARRSLLTLLLLGMTIGLLASASAALAMTWSPDCAGILRSSHRHGATIYDANVEVITGSGGESPEDFVSFRRTFRLDSKTKYYWQNSNFTFSRVSPKTYWGRVKAKKGPFYRNIGVRAKKVKGVWKGSAVYGGFAAS